MVACDVAALRPMVNRFRDKYEVLDEQATAFSKMLYTALAGGLSLDEAVSTGRQAMLGGEAGKAIEWGVLAAST